MGGVKNDAAQARHSTNRRGVSLSPAAQERHSTKVRDAFCKETPPACLVLPAPLNGGSERPMAYDEQILERVRRVLPRLPLASEEVLTERRMFGGVCITLNGKMLAGVAASQLVIRLEE